MAAGDGAAMEAAHAVVRAFLAPLSAPVRERVLQLAASTEGHRTLHALLKDAGVQQLGARQQAVVALHHFSTHQPSSSSPPPSSSPPSASSLPQPSSSPPQPSSSPPQPSSSPPQPSSSPPQPSSSLPQPSSSPPQPSSSPPQPSSSPPQPSSSPPQPSSSPPQPSSSPPQPSTSPPMPTGGAAASEVPPGHTAFSWGCAPLPPPPSPSPSPSPPADPLPPGHTRFSWGSPPRPLASARPLPSAEQMAATARAKARGAMAALSSQLKAAHAPEKFTCAACRKQLAAALFRRPQREGARRRCAACDFSRAGCGGGVRFEAAVAATTLLQARARGRLARRGVRAEGTAAAAAAAAAAEAEAEEADERDVALSAAVGLYDQMALVGVAPPRLVPLRAQLPALLEVAYRGEPRRLREALHAAGVEAEQVERCALALAELVGATLAGGGEAAEEGVLV